MNQAEIVEALRGAGCTVQSLHRTGGGVPDLLVGHAERNYLLEVKGPRGKLTRHQVVWFSDWRGQARVVRTPEEALRAVGLGND